MSLARAVFEKWSSQGVVRDDVDELRDGRGPVALASLAERRGVQLPGSFRELWLLSDGTGAMDEAEFIFWPLDNIADDPSLGPAGFPARHVIFADFRLCSVVFSLVFEDGMPRHVCAERVGAVGDQKKGPERVADSFDDFLMRYLTAPRGLIP